MTDTTYQDCSRCGAPVPCDGRSPICDECIPEVARTLPVDVALRLPLSVALLMD